MAPVGYAITVSEGAGLVYKNSCLIGNAFLGPAPVVLNENTFFVLIGSFADVTASLLFCGGASNVARFRTEEERIDLAPQCSESQEETCMASIF